MKILFSSLFSLMFVVVGAIIFGYAMRVARKAAQSLSWPTAEGEITRSAAVYQTELNETSGGTDTFKADTAYQYVVNARSYVSSRISMADFMTASTTGRAQSIAEQYPSKSRVEVFYNPSDPSEAVLEPGDCTGIKLIYFIGGIFAAAGLFFLIMILSGHVRVNP